MPVWCSPPSVTWRLSGPWPTASAGTRDRRTPTSAPVLDALLAFVEARYADCAAVLGALPPSELTRLGGNAVQRRVLVETRGVALLRAGCAVVARGPERALES